MTYPVEPYMEPNSQALVNPSDYDGQLFTGLEDLDESDLTIPRLKIDHKAGVLKDAQTGMQYDKVFAVLLGLVKQRVLFHPSMESEDEKPMCRAPQFHIGYPNLNPAKPFKAFPWAVAGFDPSGIQPDAEGNIALPCEACNLRNWGTHPTGEKPYCAEQHTMPLLYAATLEELQAGAYSPALLTIQKTGLRASKNYLSPFAQRKVGVYTAYTRVGLNVIQKGDNQYATPAFTTVGMTPTEQHMEFSDRLRALREFVHSSRPRTNPEQQQGYGSQAQQFSVPPVHHGAPQTAGPYINTGQTIPGQVMNQPDPWAETTQQPWPPAQPAPAVQQPPAPQPVAVAQQPMQAPVQQATPPQMAPPMQAAPPMMPMMQAAPPMPPMMQATPPMPQAAPQAAPQSVPVMPAPQPATAQQVQAADDLDDLPF